jgi:glycosyltransferase involved in cell wall biosynthesis
MSATRTTHFRRLRVLVLAPHPYFQERGTPMAVDALVRGLSGRGYDVDLLVYHEGSDREIPGCTLHRIPRIPGVRNIPPGPSWEKLVCDFVMLAEAVRLMRRRRFDLIHSVEEASLIALALKRLFRVPYVYDMDSSLAQQTVEKYGWMSPARRVFEVLERWVIRRSLGVVAVNRSLENLALTASPEHLVARLEDFSLLDGTNNGSAARPFERLRDTIDRDGPLVLYVGNLMPYQGIDLLLHGFRHAADRHPTAQLVIIGGNADEIPTYRTRVADLELSQRVHFVGPRPSAHLGWFLAQATVLVSPRTVGVNTPMKIYSYLGSGRPVLATRLPTHTQVLDDGIAHLVDPEPTALGDGLLRLLGDEALRRRLAANARERVAREHSHQAYLRKLNGFFDQVERLLPRRPGRTPPSAAPSPSAVPGR